MTEIERNKQIARDFFATISRSDIPTMLDFYAEDGTVETMGNTLISGKMNKEQMKVGAALILDAFPKGIVFTIHNLTAEGDRVAVEAESHGIHASGKPYNNKYHFFMTFRDGKVVSLKEYMDTEHITDVLCGGQRRG